MTMSTHIDIRPVISRERISYTAASTEYIEAKAYLEKTDPFTIAYQPYADPFQVRFEAPRKALAM